MKRITTISWAPMLCLFQAVLAADLSVTPSQIRALGIATQAVLADAPQRLVAPAEVVVSPGDLESIAAPVAGRVETIDARLGQTVAAGQPLLRLSSAQGLDLVRETETAKAALTLATQTAERDRQLFAAGLIARSRLETSEAALMQAQTRSRQALRQQELSGVLGDRSSQDLASPRGGVVLEVMATPGARVAAGDTLLRLARVDRLFLDIRVPAALAAEIAVGSAVAIDGRALQATVTEIGRAVVPGTQALPLRAKVVQGADTVRLGELVGAAVTMAPRADAVTLSSRAVWREGSVTRVFVRIAPGRFRAVEVQVERDDGATALVRGIRVGDEVVVRGVASLKSMQSGD